MSTSVQPIPSQNIHPLRACSAQDAAELLGVSPDLIRRLVIDGDLKASYIKRRLVIKHSDLHEYLEKHQYVSNSNQ